MQFLAKHLILLLILDYDQILLLLNGWDNLIANTIKNINCIFKALLVLQFLNLIGFNFTFLLLNCIIIKFYDNYFIFLQFFLYQTLSFDFFLLIILVVNLLWNKWIIRIFKSHLLVFHFIILWFYCIFHFFRCSKNFFKIRIKWEFFGWRFFNQWNFFIWRFRLRLRRSLVWLILGPRCYNLVFLLLFN